jgi:hypothetical protein
MPLPVPPLMVVSEIEMSSIVPDPVCEIRMPLATKAEPMIFDSVMSDRMKPAGF